MNPSQEECAICLEGLRAREGQALFTAECSHTFHFNCIASNVQHGNHICPTCRCKWTNLPSQFTPAPDNVPPPPNFNLRRQVYRDPIEEMTSLIFSDDEPLPSPDLNNSSAASASQTPHVQSGQAEKMTVKALPERPAMSSSEQSDLFPVLIGIRAPSLSPEASDRPDARAPVDLVAVLDVSGSMNGEKIRLLKQAMIFVVDNLGPTDRLSVITFSTSARRVTPLQIMADAGRSHTTQAVHSLRATGSTNIIAGLKLAVQVLEQRRQKNPVASIILLSDGQDNQNGHGARFLESLRHLPTCIRANASNHDPLSSTPSEIVPVPVHTFGFGSDHDATALHGIADGSGGTFSYIESIEIIQDAFARCIGGLLSVVAQQVEIHLQSGVPAGVQIRSISSGRYRNTVDNDASPNGIVHVGDVYAEEEKNFLVNLSVPQETDLSSTKLLEVKCSYKDPISSEDIVTEIIIVEIRRPTTENLSEADRQVCVEVDRERNRISIAEGIAEAQSMADRGEFREAQLFLCSRRRILTGSSTARAGDMLTGLLEADVREIEEGMTSRALYEAGGRAVALSKQNSHMYQRASTQAFRMTARKSTGSYRCLRTEEVGYQTNCMRKMVKKSQKCSKIDNQGEQSGAGGNRSSDSNPP